ncbi:MAG TPA: glycoside hydrolase family 3 N-terminal domain-containing protein [Verrucomicrobiae bacterium]|nr:glycoside hydrolase family 3 N-terminal domain-containing protein [Verrucomicrobiae bacterium]
MKIYFPNVRKIFLQTPVCREKKSGALAKILLPAILINAIFISAARAQFGPLHEKQVNALLSQMTLDEKIGQMVQVDITALQEKSDVQKYFLGSVLSGGDSDPENNTPDAWRKSCEEFQSWALKTRLKIPLIYGVDAVHGHNNVLGAVIFPHNIGLGATRDAALVERAARVTAEETEGTAIRWAFAPCVAVARDERWGRTYESFGESPELVSELGAAAVRGFQGDQLSGDSVLACAKHFLADGGTQNGVDQGNTVCDEATLRSVYLPPYIAAIKAGVGSIMVSYSSWNGKKMSENKYLLTDVLKKELGFQGFLVSDWAAIDQLSTDYKTAIDKSINAGMDMVMIPNGPGKKNNYIEFIGDLKELIAEGKVPESRIDDAARRILRVKFAMGLFENPRTDSKLLSEIGSAAHRAVARECVRESLVLLKNENHALPLSKKAKRIAVVGKAADDIGIQCGGWTIGWQSHAGKVTTGGTTILEGIRHAVAKGTDIVFSEDGSNVQAADAAVVVVGEMPYAEMKGDRSDLRVPAKDLALIHKVKSAGIPVVTILLSGRPLVLGTALDDSDAFVAAWLPGTEGDGVADVLFGDFKPRGKLPRTWPRNNDQLSTAAALAGNPLFPYGFGLSY